MIRIKLIPSESNRTISFDYKDEGYSRNQWEALTADEREEILEKFVENLPEHPFWVIESIKQ